MSMPSFVETVTKGDIGLRNVVDSIIKHIVSPVEMYVRGGCL